MNLHEIEHARRMEASGTLLHCLENGPDEACVGRVRLYRTSIGALSLCAVHSTKTFDGEGISDDVMSLLGFVACGPTTVLRMPLADLWDSHEAKALRLRRLGLISKECAVTPCAPCNEYCVCPCHDGKTS